MRVKNKAQVAIEFLLLTTFSVFFLLGLLLVLSKISSSNAQAQGEKSFNDLGTSIRNELLTASEMEDGYTREINLPKKIRGMTYNISISNGTSGLSYLMIQSGTFEVYYSIPKTSGTITTGRNLIQKNDEIYISHIS